MLEYERAAAQQRQEEAKAEAKRAKKLRQKLQKQSKQLKPPAEVAFGALVSRALGSDWCCSGITIYRLKLL